MAEPSGEKKTRTAPTIPWDRVRAWLAEDGWRRAVELGALAAVFALVAWPIARAAWLPFVDYPEHLGTIAALHGAHDPRFSPYLVTDYPRTQYLFFYWVGQLLAGPLGIEGAGRATVILGVATLPVAVAVWLREHGRPPLLGAIAGGVAMHTFVMWGFLNYAMAMPLALLALAALARLVRRPDVTSAAVLAAAALATFYCHAQLFAWFAVAAVVQTAKMGAPAGWRRTGRAVLFAAAAAVPAVVAFAVWIRNSNVLAQGVAGSRSGLAQTVGDAPPVFHEAQDTLRQWLAHSFATFNDGAGEKVALAFFGVVLTAVVLRGTGVARGDAKAPAVERPAKWWGRVALAAPVPSFAPEAVLVVTVLLYLFGPFSYRYIEPINERFLPLALALLPALGPRVALGRVTRLSLAALCVALALFVCTTYGAHFRETDGEMGELDAALAHARPGKRLLGLIFDRQSAIVPYPTYLHAHQYYQAHRGGLACFGFVEFPISPIQYRRGAEPPPFPPRFEWTPERYDHAVYGDAFDYWLIRHAPGMPAPNVFTRPSPSGAPPPHVVFDGDRWTLFARRGL